jgi:hypothetical protein
MKNIPGLQKKFPNLKSNANKKSPQLNTQHSTLKTNKKSPQLNT